MNQCAIRKKKEQAKLRMRAMRRRKQQMSAKKGSLAEDPEADSIAGVRLSNVTVTSCSISSTCESSKGLDDKSKWICVESDMHTYVYACKDLIPFLFWALVPRNFYSVVCNNTICYKPLKYFLSNI